MTNPEFMKVKQAREILAKMPDDWDVQLVLPIPYFEDQYGNILIREGQDQYGRPK